jgi:formate C-acetyltransferase
MSSLDFANPDDLEKIQFLKAVLITSQAAVDFTKRYARMAKKMAGPESDPKRKVELLKIAEIMRWVPSNPARNFHEALQCLWFVHLITRLTMNGNAFALGRLDQLLYPYYQQDLEKGELSKEEAIELLECFYLKVASVNILRATSDAKFFGGFAIWNLMTLGGQTKDGKDATNEISYMCLDAMQELKLPQPDICIRLHSATPHDFYTRSVKLLRLGLGHPKYQSDEIIIPYMLERGVPLEEARDYVLVACVEARAEKEGNYLTAIYLNLGAPLEFMFNNGVLRYNNRKIGLDTGDPVAFSSFEEVTEAYHKQFAHLCYHAAIASGQADVTKREMLAAPFLSSMREDCIERAQDLWKYGAAYNDGGGYWSAIGVADTINSLAAIKRLVFEEKKVNMKDLKEALDKNFEGLEGLRQMLINRAPKWGNDDEYADGFGEWLMYMFAKECHKYRNGLGGKYQPEVTTLTANIPFGTVLGALPNGRKAGIPLTDGISPEPNSERDGVIGAIKSASKLFCSPKIVGTLHNMKFSPLLLQDDRGVENFCGVLKSYLIDLKGWHTQFNVINAETLKNAQEHPENYPHLIVKVAGYSAYFAELDKSVQDEIIARTEYCSCG